MSSYAAIWATVDGTNFQWIQQEPATGEFPEDLLEDFSQRYQEAIFMSVQTTVDLFLYSHWKQGEKIREIEYVADEGWYALTGIKEDWEQHLFQEQEKLLQISYLDLERFANNPNMIKEYQQAQQSAKEIEKIWATAELCEGCFYPMTNALNLYGLVSQHFNLTTPTK